MQEKRRCLLIGNSRWHWAIEKTDQWYFTHTAPDPKTIKSLQLALVTWAAVGLLPKDIFLSPSTQLRIKDVPIKNLPTWLGIDRALAGWGAFKKAKLYGSHSKGLLVADAGTVLSLTRITANGEFAGGQLIAGLNLQLAAMANGTKNLENPGFQNSTAPQFPFKTSEAMQRGTLQALIGSLLEAIKDSNMPLWLCGGDAPVLVEELRKRDVNLCHHPNLALEGMVDIQHKITPEQGH